MRTARAVVEQLRDERLTIRHRFGTNAKRRQDGEREAYRLVLQALADEDGLALSQPPREYHVDWPGAAETP